MVKRLVPFLPALVALLAIGAVALTSFPPLSAAARGIGLGCALASIFVALVATRPEIRSHASVSLASAAMVAAGQTPQAPAYMVLALPFVVACLATLRAPRLPVRDPRTREAAFPGKDRDWATRLPVRARPAAIVAGTLASFVAGSLALGIPPGARWAEARVDELLQGRIELQHAVGFSDRLRLGYSAKMLESDRVVLHIQGKAPELLVGAVYDTYDGDLWVSSHEGEASAIIDTPDDFAPTSRVLLAGNARVPRGGQSRFFVAPGTCRIGTPTGRAAIDGNGIARPTTKDDAHDLTILAPLEGGASGGRACEPALAPRPPSAADTQIPAHARAKMDEIAAAWLAGHDGAGPAETVELFARRLQTFGYSLSVRRPRNVDPVVDLLTAHPEGHCEMFAAALTLLARARGIPARVVTGYRVSEVNPISGFAVVRERNAHAWVVAWVDGRWVTVDPTPAAEMLGKPKPTWSALVFDALATWVERGWAAALRVDPVSAGLGFVALGLSYIGLRRAFLALRKRRSAGVTAVTSAALSSYDDLERALARAGLLRKASEPIERFADRVASGTEAWAPEVAAVIRAYAGHSYGGLGAEPEIALSLSGLAARVTREASA